MIIYLYYNRNGMLPDKSLSQVSAIHSTVVDSDSDFDID